MLSLFPSRVRTLSPGLSCGLILILIVAGCAVSPATGPRAVAELKPGIPAGYLTTGQIPDSLALVPPPPARDSTAFGLDTEVNRTAFELRGTPRWKQAAMDADLSFPNAAGAFSCALGVPINFRDTPRLYQLLQRSLVDAALSVYKAKNHYQRARPFPLNGEPICTPQDEGVLSKDGSYPSGHTAFGWAWALILAEIAPERADALYERGRSFGESRLVCNVHWQSDILQGRFMAAAAVSRLHGNAEFRQDILIAREEVASMRSKRAEPDRDCAMEAKALSQKVPGAL